MFTNQPNLSFFSIHPNRTTKATKADSSRVPHPKPCGRFKHLTRRLSRHFRSSDDSSTRSLSVDGDPIFDTGSSVATSGVWSLPAPASDGKKMDHPDWFSDNRPPSARSDTTLESHYICDGIQQPITNPAHDTARRTAALRGEDTSAHDRQDAGTLETYTEPEARTYSKEFILKLTEPSAGLENESSAAPSQAALDHWDNTDLDFIDHTSVKDDFWTWDKDRQRFFHTEKDTGKQTICPEFFD